MSGSNAHDSVFVLFSLGSNLGNREDNLIRAAEYLKISAGLTNYNCSSFYETEPVGFKDQPWFLNVVVSGYTSIPADFIMGIIKNIEEVIGRKQREKWHEREIDIDILLYGNLVIKSDNLTIPHPSMHERRFVLVPAAEIAGEIIIPESGKTIYQLLEECCDSSIVKNIG
ncbi:MAG: 2-amino-4-hydroxy-6-hydroxymethyldihydropteridine diphosphokinase [Ignavibacteriae bacterium]|nr:2-amino-4-hydroxy-6-hydroxymethyldihydropteridine diphosphokinase [Ignavibacteriota bacterium]